MLSARVRAFDWLRGLAILFMIQCHAMVLLTEELRRSPLAKTLLWYDGLVAPAFIFTSGFSLALVQVRAAQSGEARWSRAKKTARRIGEVFLVATLVNWMWFPIFREPKWILRFDILHCIALSLSLALPLIAVLARRPAVLAGVSVILAFAIFGLAPYGEQVSGPFALLFSKVNSKTTFPLTPWAGYVFLGASAGAWAGTGNLRRLVFWMLGLAGVGCALWQLQPLLFHEVYPTHQPWETNPGNHGQRWMWISILVLTLLTLELKAAGPWTRSPPVRFLEVFGGSSLAAYFFHQELLFYRLFGWGFSFNAWWKSSCGFPKYFALTAVIIAATFVLCVMTDKIYTRLDKWLAGRAS
ncbi:MAG: heparan-alpha-glucosaminide N-acetyltransferase domain-containing protein [Myxococcaceae bacterium]